MINSTPNRTETVTPALPEPNAPENILPSFVPVPQGMDDSAPDTIAFLSDKGKYLYVNSAFCSLVNLPLQDIIGRTPPEIFQFLNPLDFAAEWEAIIRRGEDKGDLYSILPDGRASYRECRVTANVLPGCHLVIARDTTGQEQKALERELRKSLDRERLIRRIASVTSQSFDVDFIVNYAAKEVGLFFKVDRCLIRCYKYDEQLQRFLYRLIGQYYSSDAISTVPEEKEGQGYFDRARFIRLIPEEAMPKTIVASTPQEYLDCMKSYFSQLESPGTTEEGILKAHIESLQIQALLGLNIHYKGRLYGRISLHQCQGTRQWEDEEVELLRSIATHIGAALYQAEMFWKEQKAKEIAQLANIRKDQFLANLSHEFRTPLNAIIGYSEMMLSRFADQLTDKQSRYMENIASSGHHLMNLVNDILDVSRIEAGCTKIYPEKVQLEPLLLEMKSIFEEMASRKQVSIRYHLAEEALEMEADPARLRQVLYNLISNALKFNRANGNIDIRFYRPRAKQWVVCEVADTGIGIPAQEIPRLFSRFYQVDNSFSKREAGSGLGLTLVKGLIELHGGEITVESQEGVGSTFICRFPVSIPALPA